VLNVLTHAAIPKFDCVFCPETISARHKAIAITPTAATNQQTMDKTILPCVLVKMLPFLKNIPAPMQAPTTTMMHDMKPNCFFLGKSLTLFFLFVTLPVVII
jgi:hypothetical protein